MKKNYYKIKRDALIHELGGQCVDCGSVLQLEIDHIKPLLIGNMPNEFRIRMKSWDTDMDNLALRCKACHVAKTAKDMGY